VDPRTREILQGKDAKLEKREICPTNNGSGKKQEEEKEGATKVSLPFPDNLLFSFDDPLSLVAFSSASSSSPSLSIFIERVFDVQRELMTDDANPIVAAKAASGDQIFTTASPSISRCSSVSSCSSAASLKSAISLRRADASAAAASTATDDRVHRLRALLLEAPWELDADLLRSMKSGGEGVPAWNLGQVLRVALLTAHCSHVNHIHSVLCDHDRGNKGGRKWSVSSAASSTASAMSTFSSASSGPPLIAQDFNWIDHGFPLMEALGLEEAAAKFDEEFEATRKIIEEVGEKGKMEWKEALRMAGIEEEEYLMEEEREGNFEEDDNQREEEGCVDKMRKMVAKDDEALCNRPSKGKLLLECIEAEARNHATILHILRAVEKLMF